MAATEAGHAPRLLETQHRKEPWLKPLLARQCPGEPEAEIVFSFPDTIPIAEDRAQRPWSAAPGTAAQHTFPAITATFPCGAIGRRALIAVVPTVFNPFPDVAVDIV